MKAGMNTARILITGITSIHGWPLYQKLQSMVSPDRLFGIRPPNMRIPDHGNVASICMTDTEALARLRNDFRPTHVLHAAGVCDLDSCEAKPLYAYTINVNGAKSIVSVFSPSCYIMYLSADLVFSGDTTSRHGYSETDRPDPVSVVGKTYLLAEKEIAAAPRHAIVRLGLPMGDSIQGKKGAIDFIEGKLKRGLPMSLFHDEYRSCISCGDLADAIVSLFSGEVGGSFHVGGPTRSACMKLANGFSGAATTGRKLSGDCPGRRYQRPAQNRRRHLNSGKAERFLGRSLKPWIY